MFINHIISELLKYLFKEARPLGACKKNYGMPSAHAALVLSIVTFASLEKFLLSKKCSFK
jgi:acid phosphatase family membrane protein YuiD